ncbi:MAG: hypothetical protein ABW220_16200 [Burkholderiaceae bacterium]
MSILDRLRGALNLVTPSVTFDDVGVTRTMKDGRTESARWDQLDEVRVMTTDEGPWGEDVYILLIAGSGGCAVPQGAAGSSQLVERLGKLAGFDNGKFIEAMGSTSNAEFVCWRRSNAQHKSDE